MRVFLVLLTFLLIASPALARDVAKNELVIEGVYTPHSNQIDAQDRATSLVVSVLAGTFTDLGPAYVAALESIGETADLIYDPMGNWPELFGYNLVVVTLSDLWWGGYFLASDEQVLATYLDLGAGCLVLIGQDYIYQRGGIAGFPTTHLGIAAVFEDANYNDPGPMNYTGTNGGPLQGLLGSMVPCFAANPWFTDEIQPAEQGLVTWQSDLYGPAEGGSVYSYPRAVFSAVEFACDDASTLATVMAGLGLSCGGIVATQQTSWGNVKHLFR